MSASTFNVIHISDLHFGRDPGRANLYAYANSVSRPSRRDILVAGRRGALQGTHDPDIALKAARTLLANARDQHVLVVSGDMAATGSRSDLAAALSFLNGMPSARAAEKTTNGTATLAKGQFTTLLVPGNHDRYKDHFGKAGGTEFDRCFSAFWPTPSERVHHIVVRHPAEGGTLAFVAADFTLSDDSACQEPSYRNRYGQGRATPQIVELLRRRTDDVRSRHAGVGVSWVIHFPFTLAGSGEGNEMALLDAERVLAAAAADGINLILSGHVHRPNTVLHPPTVMMCAGSATACEEAKGNYVHFLKIRVDGGKATLVGRRDMQWKGDAEDFIEVATTPPIMDLDAQAGRPRGTLAPNAS